MADNNLESFIRQDQAEWTQSSAIAQIQTWIFYDARTGTPLANIYDKAGNRVTKKYKGARYLSYTGGRLTVQQELGEVNGDSSKTVYNFLTTGLAGCVGMQQNGNGLEVMVVFSSHGTGFAGYGGDEDVSRRRLKQMKAISRHHRSLLQPNDRLANAIEQALADTDGAPDQLSVLGFDACLMSSLLAFYHYSPFTQLLLASEATEPGHGWAYDELTDTSSARNLAKQVVETFVSSRHGRSKHQAPKLLALVSSTGFDEFTNEFESLLDQMTSILVTAKDPDFHALLHRARASSVAFESYLDTAGVVSYNSAVDIGSFFRQLQLLCQPTEGTVLSQTLDATIQAYNNMYLARGTGPGTTQGATGMHVLWPVRSMYQKYKSTYDYYWLKNSNLKLPPSYLSFIQAYLSQSTPSRGRNQGSVCEASTVVTSAEFLAPTSPALNPPTGSPVTTPTTLHPTYRPTMRPTRQEELHTLLVGPKIIADLPKSITLQTEVTTETDLTMVEVGIDSSALYKQDVSRRELLWNVEKEQSVPSPGQLLRRLRRPSQQNAKNTDYFYIYLGTIAGEYQNATYTATWDRNFLFLGDAVNGHLPVYVYDHGYGSRSVPVLYFSADRPITRGDIPVQTTLEQAMAMGGRLGSLHFGYNTTTETITTGFSLMTSSNGSAISETLPSEGGQIVPILFADGVVDGYKYGIILGGFDRSIWQWSEANPLEIVLVPASRYLHFIPNVNTLLFNIKATDTDVEGLLRNDVHTLRITDESTRKSSSAILQQLTSVLSVLSLFWII